jgi:hypothetical protein
VDKTKMANEVWETLFKDRRKVSSGSSHQKSQSSRIRSYDQSEEEGNKSRKAIRETTKADCQKDESL